MFGRPVGVVLIAAYLLLTGLGGLGIAGTLLTYGLILEYTTAP